MERNERNRWSHADNKQSKGAAPCSQDECVSVLWPLLMLTHAFIKVLMVVWCGRYSSWRMGPVPRHTPDTPFRTANILVLYSLAPKRNAQTHTYTHKSVEILPTCTHTHTSRSSRVVNLSSPANARRGHLPHVALIGKRTAAHGATPRRCVKLTSVRKLGYFQCAVSVMVFLMYFLLTHTHTRGS